MHQLSSLLTSPKKLFIFLLLIIGLPLATWLALQQQDVRQRASESPNNPSVPTVQFSYDKPITSIVAGWDFMVILYIDSGSTKVTALDFTFSFDKTLANFVSFTPQTNLEQLINTSSSANTTGSFRYAVSSPSTAGITGKTAIGYLNFISKAPGTFSPTLTNVQVIGEGYTGTALNTTTDFPSIAIVTVPTKTPIPPTPTTVPTATPVPPTATPVPPTVTSAPLAGDINGDQSLDILDYNIWRNEFTKLSTTKQADLNKDSKVDLLDFSIWRDAFINSKITPTQTATPTPVATNIYNKKVLAIVFNPTLTNGKTLQEYKGWGNPTTMFAQTIQFFKDASNNRVNYQITERYDKNVWLTKVDGFKYTESQYLAVESGQQQHHNPDEANYLTIINDPEYDICNKFNQGQIDEVWLMGGPWFGFYESRLAGTNSFYYNSPPLTGTTCNKPMPIMGFSYEPGWDNMVHDWGHRMESTMSRVYGWWSQNSQANNFNKFALDKVESPNFSSYGCGSTHNPPNAGSGYDYGSQTMVPSYCDTFKNYPNISTTTTTNINCTAWGCTPIGYYKWWFEHVPAAPGVGPDGKLNDWWDYLMNPVKAMQ